MFSSLNIDFPDLLELHVRNYLLVIS